MKIALDVRYRDLDTLGHVNNAVYLTYFEHARLRLFQDWFTDDTEPDFVIAHASIDYIRPIFLSRIEIEVKVTHIGRTSFTLEYTIRNERGEICATGRTIQVLVHPKSGEKIVIEGDKKTYLKSLME